MNLFDARGRYRRLYKRNYETFLALDGYKRLYRNVSCRMMERLINLSCAKGINR